MPTGNVLMLEPHGFSGGLQGLLRKYAQKGGVPMMQYRAVQLTTSKMQVMRDRKPWADEDQRAEFMVNLQMACERLRAQVIIVNDPIAASFLSGKPASLALLRGGVYEVELPTRTIAAVVVDKIQKVKTTRDGPIFALADMRKAVRWYTGDQKKEPRYQLTLCDTPGPILELARLAADAVIMACDVETVGRNISCSGYTVVTADGDVRTFVIPFINGAAEDGRVWDAPTEEWIWLLLREIHDLPVPKVMQNGSYDSHYYIRNRVPMRNYLLDTAHIFHSVWPEMPKRLDVIASLMMDHYRYWKDEGKEEAKDDNKASARIPATALGMQKYWNYNGLDTYYTCLSAYGALKLLLRNDWAVANYVEETRAQIGPALRMSMTGAYTNKKVKDEWERRNNEKATNNLTALRVMVNDPEYNPNSAPQTASLIYDVLRAKPIARKGRSTNEKVLDLLRDQSPLLDIIIQQIWDAKKPANNASKYGEKLWLMHGRWMYKLNAAGTDNGRYSSKDSDFHIGTQIQNVPEEMRTMIEPDPGYVLFDADYGKSDNWFTAFESEEPAMMQLLIDDAEGGKDAHCYHAHQFFQKPYDEIYAGYKSGQPWVVDSLRGVRQITKRIVYGANYWMAAWTLFIQMGRRAVIAAAEQLGYHDARTWSDKRLVDLCGQFLDFYRNVMYPGLTPWFQTEIQRAVRNGNKAQCAFGRTRTFLGDLANDTKIQREFAAFFGQGGTAGNINKAIDNIYYHSDFYARGGMLLFQVHDSIIGQVPMADLDLIDTAIRCMENECEVKGRKFHVPVECAVGLGWGKQRMVKWPATLADMRVRDKQWQDNFWRAVA